MPSTLVALRMTSAPISFARNAAVVSVEKNGIAGSGDEDDDVADFQMPGGSSAG